jgi:hypothetical protein
MQASGYGRARTHTDAGFANTIRGILLDYDRNHHNGDHQIASSA